MNLAPYPEPALEVLDPRFEKYTIGNSGLEQLWTGARWAEGPVWFGDARCLLFSDIPNNRILRWDEETGDVSVYRKPSHNSNGHTRDRQGRLVSCEHGARRVTRTELTGQITVLMDSFDGKRLNAPNDVVVKSDDSIWFTDPGYGILLDYEGGRADFELPTRVYRIDGQTGAATVVIEEMDRPNGLCFSPDESILYVADSGAPKHILAFDVNDDGTLSNSRVFADMRPGLADGMRVDEDGNLWTSAGWGGADWNGVHCFAPDGTLIGRIHIAEPGSNVCFGGRVKNRLFITAGRSLYSIFLNTRGVQTP
ncbi:MAG: SMP-30/gluconolactonase/LRE family protein [Caldilineaceae bacterium]